MTMLEGVTNNITVNKQNPYWNMGTNSSIPAQATTGTLERQPKTDSVELSKKPMSKQTKTLLTIGGIATAILGTVLAVKGYRSHQITKGLEQIEQKFLKLQENIPEVQKTFKDVFLRGDITEKEALEMLNRYKEVEKIRVTGTKEEYARALFDEAKRNYGFADSNLKISYFDTEGRMGGGFGWIMPEITIDSKGRIKRLMNTIHHELRHAKQTYYAINMKPDEYLAAMRTARKGTNFENLVSSYTPEEILKIFGMSKPNKHIVPSKYESFVDNVIQGEKKRTYSADYFGPEYMNNFLEVDARSAGESMAKLFGLMTK